MFLDIHKELVPGTLTYWRHRLFSWPPYQHVLHPWISTNCRLWMQNLLIQRADFIRKWSVYLIVAEANSWEKWMDAMVSNIHKLHAVLGSPSSILSECRGKAWLSYFNGIWVKYIYIVGEILKPLKNKHWNVS